MNEPNMTLMSKLVKPLIAALLVSVYPCAVSPGGQDPVVRVRQEAGDTLVEGSVEIAAPRSVVWEALTDYDRLPLYVAPLEASRLIETRDDSTHLVEQTSIASFAFFRRRSRARFLSHHHEQSRITTTFIEGDFDRHETEWRLETRGGKTRLAYSAAIRSSHRAPGWIVNRIVRGAVSKTLTGLCAESVARSSTLTRP